MFIRKARNGDIQSIIDVTTRSIRELCTRDHKPHPETLGKWLRNKNPETVRSWISDEQGIFLIAILNGSGTGVAMANMSGYISLCYVDPDYVGKGIGKSLMQELERRVRSKGLCKLALESTETAHEFSP